MKGIKLASSDHERARLRDKCKELLARAEEIKKLESWPPPKSVATILNLKVPISQRAVSRSEEIILLEGSKLHGFIFPPWTAEPEDKMFDEGGIYT
jgi:calpain-7